MFELYDIFDNNEINVILLVIVVIILIIVIVGLGIYDYKMKSKLIFLKDLHNQKLYLIRVINPSLVNSNKIKKNEKNQIEQRGL